MVRLAATLALLLLSWPASAQLSGRHTPAGCVSVADGRSRVTAGGRLTVQLFPGAPNFESIAAGDAEERTFILELPRAVCIDDGGDFADPREQFVTVQIAAADPGLADVLRASIGRRVTVGGEGFASHTGHHHAPLVVLVDEITVR